MKYYVLAAKISREKSFVKCFQTILDKAIGFFTKTLSFKYKAQTDEATLTTQGCLIN